MLNPPDWAPPKGYSNGIEAEGRLIFVAGQIGWDEQQQFREKTFAGQLAQALRNIVAVLAAADAGPEHIVRMTWYVTDKAAYLNELREVGRAYRQIIGRHYPAMAVVAVSGLVEDAALVEIEATAVAPRRGDVAPA